MQSHSIVRPPSANDCRRHLYLFYLFRDKTGTVQTSRFSETDCTALSDRAPGVSTGRPRLPFVPGSRTSYRTVSSYGRAIFVIIMQTRVAIRDRRRCNVVVVAATLILAGLTRARTRSARYRLRARLDALRLLRYRRVNIWVSRSVT